MPFGVGLMIWVLEDRPDLFEATIAAAAQPRVGVLRRSGALRRAAARRGDRRRARRSTRPPTSHRALDAGVDVLVAQGTEAGGHTGQRATLPLLQEVLTLTDRPVVAAGGIATGGGMAAALVAGAAGVWIGTPLLSCTEGLNTPAARERDPRRLAATRRC